VIITDGSANVPLKRSLETGELRTIEEPRVVVREYEDLAVKDVFAVSKIIRRDGINAIVVNTNPHVYGRESYGFEVTRLIASTTNGAHHVVGTLETREKIVDNIVTSLKEDQDKLGASAF